MSDQQEQFTEEELSNLDDAEREALGIDQEEEPDNEEKEQDNNETVDENNEQSQDEPEPEQEAKQEPVAEQTKEPEPEPEVDRLDEIAKELSALGDKLEDGDIDFKEYNEINNRLTEERQDIKLEQKGAERDAKEAQKSDEQSWNEASVKFLSDPGNSIIETNKFVQGAFLNACREIQATPEAAGKDYSWLMAKAKESLIDSGGFNFGNSKQEEPAQHKPESRTPDSKIPVTLGDNAPASEKNDANEFSHLSNLDGLDLEEALARMTPEQEARYLEAS